MRKVQSTCNFCAIDCNLDFYVEDGRIVKTVPTKGYPVNNGFSCIKGLSLSKQQTTVKPNALPKIRQADGSFQEVSWDQAFTHVADKILELQDKYGRESVAGISTGQLTLEEFAIFGHVMRNFLQTNVDGNTRLCMASAAVAHKGTYGYDAPGYTLDDFEKSDTIIFIGANPVVAHPIIWQRVRNNTIPDRKIIVLDPRRSETARNADYHYPLRWRSDLTLMYTLANLLIEKDCVDHAFVEAHTEGFPEFAEFVKAFTLERGCKATGLSEAQILELADLIQKGRNVSFWWTMGVNQGYEAVRTAQAIMNLALMTGNVGRPGTGGNSITGQCNAMASRLFSNTTCLFAGGDFTDEAERARIADIVGISPDLIAKKPTIPYNKIVEGINAGLAPLRKVLDRGENEISDYECILGVAKALGMGDAISRWETPRECFDLLRECSRGRGCDFTGVHWDDLTDSHGRQWPYPEGREAELSDDQRRLYADGKFFTPSGKAKFIFEEPLENPIPVTEEFPLVFNTGRGTVGQWHTQSRTKEVKFVEDVSLKKAYLYMNTRLAKENGIQEMDMIRVFSSNGQNAEFMVKVTDNVQYGELYAPIHYIECNKLTPSSYDKYSREPNYKGGTCRFEKV